MDGVKDGTKSTRIRFWRGAAAVLLLLGPLLAGGCLTYERCDVVVDFELQRALFTFQDFRSRDQKAEDADILLSCYYLGHREDDVKTSIRRDGERIDGQVLLTGDRISREDILYPSAMPLPAFRFLDRTLDSKANMGIVFRDGVEVLEANGTVRTREMEEGGKTVQQTVIEWPAGTKRLVFSLQGTAKEGDAPLLPIYRERLRQLAEEGTEALSVEPPGAPSLGEEERNDTSADEAKALKQKATLMELEQ